MVEFRHDWDLLIEYLVAIVPLSFLGLHASWIESTSLIKNRLRLMSGSCEIDAFFKIHSRLIDVYIDSTRSKRFLSDF